MMKTKKNQSIVFVVPLLFVLLISSGCQFFGKKDDAANALPTGQLSNGQTILGVWSTTSADTSTSGNPSYAITTTYEFDANGSAKITLTSLKEPTFQCVGFGMFRNVSGKDFVVYLQTSTGGCTFNTQIVLSDVDVKGLRLQYSDLGSKARYSMFYSRNPLNAPVGVWGFNSAGGDRSGNDGIDYLLIDPSGYFLLQTHEGTDYFLIEGRYQMTSDSLALYNFQNEDPSSESPTPVLSFSEFFANGKTLKLTTLDASGNPITFTGNKL